MSTRLRGILVPGPVLIATVLELAMLLVVMGCGDQQNPTDRPPYSVRDSGGVEIVDVHAPAARVLSVEAQPVVRIGVVAGESEYQFSGIRAAVALQDGRIAVLDRGSREVRLFDAAGAYVRTIGRAGEGPGEFRTAWGLRAVGDTLEVDDFYARVRYLADGTLLDHETLDLGRVADLVGFSGNCLGIPRVVPGGILACQSHNSVFEMPQREGPWRITSTVVRLPSTLERVDTVAELLDVEGWVVREAGRFLFVQTVWSPEGRRAVGTDPPILASAETWDYTIDVRSLDGSLLRKIRRDDARRSLTEEEIETGWKQAAMRLFRDTALADAARGRVPIPETVSTIRSLFVDTPGRIWVRVSDDKAGEPSRFDVFEQTGAYLGEILLPPRFAPLEITTDYVLGVRRDDLDVEFVEMYLLHG